MSENVMILIGLCITAIGLVVLARLGASVITSSGG
jgi:hypothetical protein